MPLFYYLFQIRTIYDCSDKNLLVLEMRVNGECVSRKEVSSVVPRLLLVVKWVWPQPQTTLFALKPEQRLYGQILNTKKTPGQMMNNVKVVLQDVP
jgi:hypothetical protein